MGTREQRCRGVFGAHLRSDGRTEGMPASVATLQGPGEGGAWRGGLERAMSGKSGTSLGGGWEGELDRWRCVARTRMTEQHRNKRPAGPRWRERGGRRTSLKGGSTGSARAPSPESARVRPANLGAVVRRHCCLLFPIVLQEVQRGLVVEDEFVCLLCSPAASRRVLIVIDAWANIPARRVGRKLAPARRRPKPRGGSRRARRRRKPSSLADTARRWRRCKPLYLSR